MPKLTIDVPEGTTKGAVESLLLKTIARKEKTRAMAKARRGAMQRLVAKHPEEYQNFLREALHQID